MEPNQIKGANFLDILFDGRNKEYGAYELRKTYNRRVVKSMVVMGSVVVLVLVGGVVMGLGKGKRVAKPFDESEFILQTVKDPQPIVTPPPPKVVQPQVATRIFTPPLIVKTDVKPNEVPPENKDLDDVKIGTVNKDGAKDGDIVGPPAGDGGVSNVVETPKKQESDEPLMVVEIDASYPGGMPAWARFMNKNLRYPEEAMNQGVGGTVLVQFVVDLEGNVSDVKVVSGPENGGLREEAERVIKRSGKWVPAIQNGRHVKAYRRQPVTFVPTPEN